jgi:hypothetical protein
MIPYPLMFGYNILCLQSPLRLSPLPSALADGSRGSYPDFQFGKTYSLSFCHLM